jgi:hypothetical protein
LATLPSSATSSFCAEVIILDKIAFLGKVAVGVISSIPLAGIAMTLLL